MLFLVAFVTMPAFVFATVAGLRSADPAARELLASVDASRCEVLWRLRLPSALPSLFAAARYIVGLALAAAYYGEGGNLVASKGLGAIGSAPPPASNGPSCGRRCSPPWRSACVGLARRHRRRAGRCCAGTCRSAAAYRCRPGAERDRGAP